MTRQRQTLVQNGVQMEDSDPNLMSKSELDEEPKLQTLVQKWDAQKVGWSKWQTLVQI